MKNEYPMKIENSMNLRRKFFLIGAGLPVLLLTSCSLSQPRDDTAQQTESMEIIAFNTQFSYGLLNMIRTNQIEEAKTMIENGVFLDLLQLWEIAGTSGVRSNRVCNETFVSIYPDLRRQVSLDRFRNVLPNTLTNMMIFVSEMDAVFLTTNGAAATRAP